jgi:Helix-turn-helix domain
MFSPDWQDVRSLLLERLGRTPSVGEVIEFLRESYEAGEFAHSDSVVNHELKAPADPSPKNQSGLMNQRLCWSLKEAAERCGVSYHTMYRAVCRGDLKIIKGFGRMMVPDSELPRFVGDVTEYLPRKRKTWKTHARREARFTRPQAERRH